MSGLGVVMVVVRMLKEGSVKKNAAVAFISCVTFKHQHWQKGEGSSLGNPQRISMCMLSLVEQ